MAPIKDWAGNGFVRHATQPEFIAACRSLSLSVAVTKITGMETPALVSSLRKSIPDRFLSMMSSTKH
jgi:hypothetical protein